MNKHLAALKKTIRKFKKSKSWILRHIYNSSKIAWCVTKFITDSRYRSEILTPLRFSNNYFQHATYTIYDRYPPLFKACAEYLDKIHQPRLLSFGCSTGEEVRTLSEYMPQATVVGIDINTWCLKQCHKKSMSEKHFFYHFYSPEFGAIADFDAIFCMAVFQRTEHRYCTDNSVAKYFTFETFENMIKVLDAKLKINGLLIIDHADFSFSDTFYRRYYEPLNFEDNHIFYKRPLYNKSNIKVANSQSDYRVFVKISEESAALST